MKSAAWNLERLKHKGALPELLAACERIQADIPVLTETGEQAKPRKQDKRLSDHKGIAVSLV